MPLGYLVPSSGRTGPELRVARGTHELLATGPAARIGTLLPNHTTTTTLAPHGAPLEVRVPFLLAQWLLLGLLVISDAVGHSPVYMYMVGAERLGAALDAVLAREVVLTLEWDLRVKGGCWPRKSGVSTTGVSMASGVLAWC